MSVAAVVIRETVFLPSSKQKTDPPKKQPANKHNKINRLRYCNVIFGDESRNDIATRGDKLSAADLTDDLKTDELLHRNISMEYNNTDKYNDNVWPHLKSCKGDTSNFPVVEAVFVFTNQSI